MSKRKRISIQRRLIGFLLFVSLVPLAATGSYGILVVNRNIRQQERFRIETILSMNVMMTKNFIARAQDKLSVVLHFFEKEEVPFLEENASRWEKKIESFFKRKERPEFSRLSFINRNGKEFFRIEYKEGRWFKNDSLSNFLEEDAFLYIKNLEYSIIDPHQRIFITTKIGGSPCIAFFLPRLDREGRFCGAILAVLSDEYINDSLTLHQRIEATKQIFIEIYLVNQDGDIIYELRPKDKEVFSEKSKNISHILPEKVSLSVLSLNSSPTYDKKNYIYLHDPIVLKNSVLRKFQKERKEKRDYLVLIEKVPLKKLYSVSSYYIHLLQLLLASFAVLSIVTGIYLSRNFLEPIKKIIRCTEEVSKGNWDYPLSISTGDEFEDLSNHFNSMISQLKTLYNNIEQKVEERTKELAYANKLLSLTKDTLAQEKKRLESVLDATKEGIIMIDPDGYLIFSNKSFKEIFEPLLTEGFIEGNWHIKNLLKNKEFFKEPERYELEFEKLLEKNDKIVTGELSLVLPKILIVNWFSASIKAENGDIIGRIIAFRDITKEKEVERMKDEFVSIVSHELRTPMTSLSGSISLVLDGTVGELNEEQRELLEVAKNNTMRLIRLINDILDISKIESGKIKMKSEPVHIKNVSTDSVEGIKSFAISNSVSIELDIEDSIPEILADRDRLVQVITNLLSNAIKFSPQNGRVYLKAWKDEKKVYVSVKDEGPGIPSEYHEKIFEKFQQVDSSLSRQKGGTGLGLPICRAILEELNGKLWLESEEGKGSTFTFFLPLERI